MTKGAIAMCTNPFCNCCRHAYLEGLHDGVQLGLKRGFNQGHKNGYVDGYVDGALRLPPPIPYQREIERKRALLPPVDSLSPRGLFKSCRCIGVCTCNRQ